MTPFRSLEIDQLGRIAGNYPYPLAKDGEMLAMEGDWEGLQWDGQRLSANLTTPSGKKRLVEMQLGGSLDCDCPTDGPCAHQYALILLVAWGIYRLGDIDDEKLESLFPAEWLRGEKTPDPDIYKSAGDFFGAEPEADDSDEAPPKTTEEWWRRFLKIQNRREREVLLTDVLRERLRLPPKDLWMTREAVRRTVETPNPVEGLSQIFRVNNDLKLYGGRLSLKFDEPGLRAFLNSDEARKLREEFESEADHSVLCEWLESLSRDRFAGKHSHSPEKIEIVWGHQKGKFGLQVLHWQMLLTTQRLAKAPRDPKHIEKLIENSIMGKRQSPPGEARMLEFLSDMTDVHSAYYSEKESEEDAAWMPVRNVLQWMGQWAGAEILRWKDTDAPIEMVWESALLSPRTDPDGQLRWHVVIPESAGRPEEILPLEFEKLYLEYVFTVDGEEPSVAFWREGNRLRPLDTGDMPIRVLSTVMRSPGLPVERLRSSIAGAALIQHYDLDENDTTGLPMVVRHVPVEAGVEIHLSPDREILLVPFATDTEGHRFLRTHSGIWMREEQMRDLHTDSDHPFRSSMDEPLESLEGERLVANADATTDHASDSLDSALTIMPRSEDVAAVETFLDNFVPPKAENCLDDRERPAFSWQHRKKETGSLIERWTMRPPGVQYLGNPAFQRLLAASKPPRISVQIEKGGIDWFRVTVEMQKELEALRPEEVRQALRENDAELIALSGGRIYRRDDLEEFEQQLDTIARLGLNPEGDSQRIHGIQAVAEGDEILDRLEAGGMGDLADQMREIKDNFHGIPGADIDPDLRHELRAYQRIGVDFVTWASEIFGGAILADDMGLGKTVQVLAALSARLKKEDHPRPSLVICPTSVTHGWQREAARFTPWLKTAILETGPNRQNILDNLEAYDVVITNYALARIEADILTAQRWEMICVDEAQAIKNPGAAITQTVKSFDTRWRVALTGTPIENRLLDLWSIADFVGPGYLWSHRAFEKRIKEEEADRMYQGLRTRLRPLLLRRLKSEVATELPPRIEERRDCEMLPEQRRAYLAELRHTRDMMEHNEDENMDGRERFQILAALTRMRQICCDPALLSLEAEGSGKVDTALELIEELLDAGHKVLLFSQFVKMLEILEKKIKARKYPYWKLTGKTRKRKELVQDFESTKEPGVFLISLKAGGTGLNLVSASHVILFDPWWNPAVEAQAIDRTHRIGQDKTVVAYRLVAQDTIEERILELQEKKRGLVEHVLEEESFHGALTREDLDYLLEGQELG